MMTTMPIYIHFLYALIATIGFSIFLSVPKKVLLATGFSGALGWTVYYILSGFAVNEVSSNFFATIFVALLSDIFARKLKHPTIIFVIPGIIPLVPGLGMYNTMLYLVQNKFDAAITKGVNVLLVSGAIALGLLIVTALVKTRHHIKLTNHLKKTHIKAKE